MECMTCYRDTDPADWAAYSHDPYAYSPTVHAPLGPGQSWTLNVMLADPASCDGGRQ
jgi:hypothetical protein